MKRSIFFFAFIWATTSLATLVGTWEGITCQSYNDGLSHGTYNYVFKEDGKVEMFIQYYDDQCAKVKLTAEPQSKGNYTVTEQPVEGEEGEYQVRLFYSGWNGIKFLKVVIKEGIMSIFDHNGDSLGNYKRLS